MGKRKDFESDSPDISISPSKKHKKHKKHKHMPMEYDESESVDVVNGSPCPSTPVRIAVREDKFKVQPGSSKSALPSAKSAKKRKGRGKDSGTSSDEERWLDAIESGKLEEVDDELKKIKDPKLMTARQRAMYDRGTDKEQSLGGEMLMSLPTGYKEKVLTAEAIQKAALKSQRRKQMADEKREKDKKKTMERLLKKQETKQRTQGRSRVVRLVEPMISYRNTVDGATISLPANHEFPLKPQTSIDPPKPVACAMKDCNNLKAYNCSKTNIPLCSFACYKKNIQIIKNEIMC